MFWPHPHSYDWHDGHTSHYGGLAKADGAHPHMDAPPLKNDQAAAAGVSTYHQYARHYGTITPGQPSNLHFYPMQGRSHDAKALVAKHGYSSYYAGGKYGKPDLANRNYNTKHLQIYDPSPGSGGDFGQADYTDAWRHVHELAHALTYPEVNRLYGEGRRIGKLGVHRNPREAKRAVHWEWLAAHKQRDLSRELGIHISDEDFNKELSTVMHDAVHRAVTGQFTEPGAEGFHPHPHKVPLETSLGLIDAAARNLRLGGDNALLQRKSEQMATHTIVDLGKAVAARLLKFEQEFLELQRLEKAGPHMEPGVHEAGRHGEAPHQEPGGHEHFIMDTDDAVPPQPVGSSTGIPSGELQAPAQTQPTLADPQAGVGSDRCPTCGNVDAPGSCTCLGTMGKNSGAGYGGNPMLALSEDMCKSCGKPHGISKCGAGKTMKAEDFIDISGKKVTKGVVGTLPGDKKSKVVDSPGSGGDVKKGKLGKAEMKTKKAEPPMAKPPGGKDPAAAPTPPVKTPKVGGMPGGPMKKAALPAAPKAQQQQHALMEGSKTAPAPAAAAGAKLPTPGEHAQRAQAHASALGGAFTPKGPVHSGLELAPKKPQGLTAPPAAAKANKPMPFGTGALKGSGTPAGPIGAPAKAKGILSTLFGKSEQALALGDCPLCGGAEHRGDCK